MKFLITATIVALGCTIGYAQPSLTSTSAPREILDAIPRYSVDPIGIAPGTGGVGLTWDFSKWNTKGNGNIQFVGRTKFTPAMLQSYPQASVAQVEDGSYTFYGIQGGFIRNHGETRPTNHSVVASSNNPFDTRPIEIVYNKPFSDKYSASITNDTVTGTRTGTWSFTYDAFGRVLLESGVVNDVARTLTLSMTIDTLVSRSNSKDTTIITTTTRTHIWQQVNSSIPLVRMTLSSVAIRRGKQTPTSKTTRTVATTFYNSTPTAVNERINTYATTWPNPVPAGHHIHISTPITPSAVEIISLAGTGHSMNWSSTDYGIEAEMPDLPKGTYIVLLRYEDGTFLSRRIVLTE